MPSSQNNRRYEVPVGLAAALEAEASAAGVNPTALARAILRESLLFLRLSRMGSSDPTAQALAVGDRREHEAHLHLVEWNAVVQRGGAPLVGWLHRGNVGAASPEG